MSSQNTKGTNQMKLKLFGVVAILCAVSAQAEVKKNEFNGGVGGWVPCIQKAVTVTGPISLQVQTLDAPNKTMVSIHGRFNMEGTDTSSNQYKSTFQMNASFDAKSAQYVVPYSSVFIGQGGAPNFKMEGDVKIYVDAAGMPVGAWIVSGTITCQGN
jgi:hypothetical protein